MVMFFCGVRDGHVFLVGFVMVMFFGGVRVGHVFWWGPC
jgi:hypothetical protein